MVTTDLEESKINGGTMESSFNLILMDLNMPGMDGNTTMVKIREYLHSNGVNQPIIAAVTGHLEQSYIDESISMGMN